MKIFRLRAQQPRGGEAHAASASTREEAQAARIAELTASRRAVADAYEIERQRIERDLHDGTQQYLVAAAIKLGEVLLELDDAPSAALVRAAKADLDHGLAALRETVRGIHPQVLSDRGLVSAVSEMAANYGSHVRVHAPHPLPTLSPSVLAAGYFFTAEALANAAKYAPSAGVSVLITADADLRISVVDDGPGGARLVPGHGLSGMRDRLSAFGGTLELSSPPGGPTRLSCTLPLLLERWSPGIAEDGRRN